MKLSRVAHSCKPDGFTLIEVLVALAVASIAFLSGLKLLQTVTQSLSESRQRSFALACADNSLIKVRLHPPWQIVGDRTEVCRQGALSFNVEVKVLPTPHPHFRRMEVRVSPEGQDGSRHSLAYRVGFFPTGF